jgi:hypothetical protein
MKYNIGDTLKIVSNSDKPFHYFDIGDIVRVEELNPNKSTYKLVRSDGLVQKVNENSVAISPVQTISGGVMDDKDIVIQLQSIVIESLVKSLSSLERDYNELKFRMEGLEK